MPQNHQALTRRRCYLPNRTLEDARAAAPWAATFVKVAGGWLAFATLADCRTWQRTNQG